MRNVRDVMGANGIDPRQMLDRAGYQGIGNGMPPMNPRQVAAGRPVPPRPSIGSGGISPTGMPPVAGPPVADPRRALKDGGVAASGKSAKRMDKASRKYADGGAVKEPKTKIDINIAMQPKEEEPGPEEAIALAEAIAKTKGGPGTPPPAPPLPPPGMDPMAGPGPGPGLGGPPPGLPPFKRGGAVSMDAGAGGGEGRLEKTRLQKRVR